MKPQLVLLCGTARAGKDSLASAIADQMWLRKHNSHVVSLGNLVRQELALATGVAVEDQLAERAGWRKIWQFWGTEVRRRRCGEDYWINKWRSVARLTPPGDSIIVPDVRFTNELHSLREWAWEHSREPRVLVVRRSRMWELAQFRRRSRLHRSEREWRKWVWHYEPVTVKNTGSLDDLANEAGDLVQSWL